jgi:hypothetical protein
MGDLNNATQYITATSSIFLRLFAFVFLRWVSPGLAITNCNRSWLTLSPQIDTWSC